MLHTRCILLCYTLYVLKLFPHTHTYITYTHARAHTYIDIFFEKHTYVCIHICVFVHIYVCTYIHTHTPPICKRSLTHPCTCMNINLTCVYIQIKLYWKNITYTYIYIYVYIHTYIYTHTYIGKGFNIPRCN